MSPTPADSSTRKRKLSDNSDLVSLASNGPDSSPKRSKLTAIKNSIYSVFNWVSDSARKTFSRDSLSYVNKAWEDLSQSFGQNYEYQGPVLEGSEMITSVPTLMPMSNVGLTASSGMPSSNLATNTTFINLAPQPSLPSLGASSNLHSGNTNLNHPLQSLHAMHPGGGGGGEISTSEISSQEAAAAIAFAVQQQQSYQLSLNRASASDSGKFGRPVGGFAPNGFSTPLVSGGATQSRLGNRSMFPLGIGVGHNTFSSSGAFSSSKSSRSSERPPIRLKKTFKNSTHDKIFSPRPKTTLRPPRSDSPAVPNVFRHLLKKNKKQPVTAKNSVNLKEKNLYKELLLASGMKFCGLVGRNDSTGSPQRSRASSVVTVDSKSSGFSGSPPLVCLNGDAKKASTSSGSKQKPISLGDSDDDDLVFVGRVASPLPPKNRVEEVVLDETPNLSSTDFSGVDTSGVDHPFENGAVVSPENGADASPVDDEGADVIEESSGVEPKNAKAVKEIEIVYPNTFSTPPAPLSAASSKGKSAFFVEKEVSGPKVVDITGEEEKVEASSAQYERKESVRKVNVPVEPEFMKAVRQSPYTDHKWLANMKHGISVDQNKNRHSADEQESVLAILRDEKEAQDRELEERMRVSLKLSQRIKPAVEDPYIESSEEESEDEEEEDKDFPILTDEMNDKVDDATNPGPPMEVLARAFNLDITRKDIRTLTGLEWLNDEIINFYMNMLVDRSEKSEGALPKVYAFNTFFYPTLIKDGYSRLKRWTRKVDLFSHDLIIIPVHLQMHWCLAVIDLAEKQIRYYDSMGGNNQKCLNALKSYLEEEHKDKKKSAIDLSGWRYDIVKDIPQQMNGSDCGMFTCKFAEYNSRRAQINFGQENMPYFRRRMIFEIVSLKLM